MAAKGKRTSPQYAPNTDGSQTSRRIRRRWSPTHFLGRVSRTQVMTLPGFDEWCQPNTFAYGVVNEEGQQKLSSENTHEEQLVDINTLEETEGPSADMVQCNTKAAATNTEGEISQQPVWVSQTREQWIQDEIENEIAQARKRTKKQRDAECTRSIQLMIENGVDKNVIEYAVRENETKPLDELQVLRNLIEKGASEETIARQTVIIAGQSTHPYQPSTFENGSLQQNQAVMCPCAVLVYKNSQESNENLEGYDAHSILAEVLDVTAKVASRNTEKMTPEVRNERRKKLGLPARPSYLRQDFPGSTSTSSTGPQRSEFAPNKGACPGATSTPISPRTRSRPVVQRYDGPDIEESIMQDMVNSAIETVGQMAQAIDKKSAETPSRRTRNRCPAATYQADYDYPQQGFRMKPRELIPSTPSKSRRSSQPSSTREVPAMSRFPLPLELMNGTFTSRSPRFPQQRQREQYEQYEQYDASMQEPLIRSYVKTTPCSSPRSNASKQTSIAGTSTPRRKVKKETNTPKTEEQRELEETQILGQLVNLSKKSKKKRKTSCQTSGCSSPRARMSSSYSPTLATDESYSPGRGYGEVSLDWDDEDLAPQATAYQPFPLKWDRPTSGQDRYIPQLTDYQDKSYTSAKPSCCSKKGGGAPGEKPTCCSKKGGASGKKPSCCSKKAKIPVNVSCWKPSVPEAQTRREELQLAQLYPVEDTDDDYYRQQGNEQEMFNDDEEFGNLFRQDLQEDRRRRREQQEPCYSQTPPYGMEEEEFEEVDSFYFEEETGKEPAPDYEKYQKMLRDEAMDICMAIKLAAQDGYSPGPTCPPPDNTDEADVSVDLAADMLLHAEQGLQIDAAPNKLFYYLYPNYQEEALLDVSKVARSPKAVVVPTSPSGAPRELTMGTAMEKAALMSSAVRTEPIRPSHSLFNDTVGAGGFNRSNPWDSPVDSKGANESMKDTTLEDIAVGIGHWPDARRSFLTSLSMRSGLLADEDEFILDRGEGGHHSFIQLRGTKPPKWFPGYMAALPTNHPKLLVVSERPSQVLHDAWTTLSPGAFQPEHLMLVGT